MKFLAFLVLISAIAIATCAAYFSIIGLKMLFVGSGVAIVVMGIALEVGKFITATFLKQKWDELDWFLRSYLVLATLVLMGITSIGIYGYLSAGYNATAVKVQGYEQTMQSNLRKIEELKEENTKLTVDPTNQKEIELINTNKDKYIEQQLKLIEQKEARIKDLRTTFNADSKSSNDLTAAKAALDAEKITLDLEINKEVEQIKLINNRLTVLDEEVQTWLKQGDRGLFRENGAEKAREVKLAQEKERSQIDTQIKERQNKIQTLRDEYRTQVEKYNARVLAIEQRLGNQNTLLDSQIKEIEKEINQIRQGIETYNVNVEKTLNDQVLKKEELIKNNKNIILQNETIIKELLASNTSLKEQIIRTDVGTFKFVANSLGLTLDKTVTYFIGAIMLVFDPLAVCLILCFNFLIKDIANKKKLIHPPEKQEEKVNIVPTLSFTPTPVPSTPEPTIEPMKSSEIIFGQKKIKPTPAPQVEGTSQVAKEDEVARLERILATQREEKANRHKH